MHPLVRKTHLMKNYRHWIYKIHEYCRKDKSDPAVIAKMQKIGVDLNADGDGGSRFFEPVARTDYRYILFKLNPQTYNTIQGISINWNDAPGLSYEEIQQLTGLDLPKRGAKEIQVSTSAYQTRFYVLGHENATHPDLTQVTVICAPDNYDRCSQIDIACYGFAHAD